LGTGVVVISDEAVDTNYLVATSADCTIPLAQATQATLSVNRRPTEHLESLYTAMRPAG